MESSVKSKIILYLIVCESLFLPGHSHGQDLSLIRSDAISSPQAIARVGAPAPGSISWDDAIVQCLNSKVSPTALLKISPSLSQKRRNFRDLVRDVQSTIFLDPVKERLQVKYGTPQNFLGKNSADPFYEAWKDAIREARSEKNSLLDEVTSPHTPIGRLMSLKLDIANSQRRNWLFLKEKELDGLSQAYQLAAKRIRTHDGKILTEAREMSDALSKPANEQETPLHPDDRILLLGAGYRFDEATGHILLVWPGRITDIKGGIELQKELGRLTRRLTPKAANTLEKLRSNLSALQRAERFMSDMLAHFKEQLWPQMRVEGLRRLVILYIASRAWNDAFDELRTLWKALKATEQQTLAAEIENALNVMRDRDPGLAGTEPQIQENRRRLRQFTEKNLADAANESDPEKRQTLLEWAAMGASILRDSDLLTTARNRLQRQADHQAGVAKD